MKLTSHYEAKKRTKERVRRTRGAFGSCRQRNSYDLTVWRQKLKRKKAAGDSDLTVTHYD